MKMFIPNILRGPTISFLAVILQFAEDGNKTLIEYESVVSTCISSERSWPSTERI